jgi:hypothetical protein
MLFMFLYYLKSIPQVKSKEYNIPALFSKQRRMQESTFKMAEIKRIFLITNC